MHRYEYRILGFDVRRYGEHDSPAITRLSSFWNGEHAALPEAVRDYFRRVNPNGGWLLELDGRVEAVFEAHLLWQPLAEVIRECPYEWDKTARHLLDPDQAMDSSAPVSVWSELATANGDRPSAALVAALPRILRTLRPRPHRSDVVAGLLHTHFRRLPMIRQALHLRPTGLAYPNYGDVVYAAPLHETLRALEGHHWDVN